MFHNDCFFAIIDIAYAPNTIVEKHEFKTQNDNK